VHDHLPGEFTRILQAASCPFAARAAIRAAQSFAGSSARAAGAAALPALADFTAAIGREELDGFLIELTSPEHGRTIGDLSDSVLEVITGLLEASGTRADDTLTDAGREKWWLTLLGTRWFVLAFAPCYRAASPRATLGSASTFLLLQPVASFDRHATPRGTVIPEHVRRAIQHAYADSGRPYDAQLALQDVEALKFVWPLPSQENHPVRWWEETARDDA
jgi:hypothetical protein